MATKKRPLPRKYEALKLGNPKLVKAYEEFGKACERSGPLSLRERRLVKLSLAFAARMEGASHSAVRKGLDAELSVEDMQHVAFLAMSTMGFSFGVMFLGWIEDVIQREQ
ncbi:MAG: carboxymuconolactone decarboxylase family protein [Planctomycetota bacterium]|nr:carboxymuconolactone decarboxylase family protein [Planctomycetota bacterium]